MAIQSRRGNKVNFDKDKMLPGEFGVALDSQEAFICFGAGITKKMATDEDYADMIEESVTSTENAKQATANANQTIKDVNSSTNAAISNVNLAIADFRVLEVSKLAINDGVKSSVSGWSSNKTSSELDTAKTTLNTSLANQIGTANGASINIPNSFNGGLLLKELQGKSTQSSTPTPEAKVDIVSVGDNGSVVVRVCGKNIFDGILEIGSYRTTAGDKIIATDVIRSANKLRVSPNTSLILSSNNSSISKMAWYFYDAKGNFISSDSSNSTRIVQIPLNCYLLAFRTFVADTSLITIGTTNIQLELGSTSTSYEPYKEQLVTIQLTQPLRSVGSVYDRGCVKSGGLWGNERKFGYAVFDGSSDESWTQTTTDTAGKWRYGIKIANAKLSNSTTNNSICNRFKLISDGTTFTKNMGYTISSSSDLLLFYDGSDLATFKTWLALNPIIIQYELATPTFEPYSQSLQDQLNKLQTYQGVTNVFTTDALQPTLSVSYGKTDTSALSIYASNMNDNKLDKSSVANNLITTVEGTFLDGRQGKALSDKIGILSDLTTASKTDLVSSVNEVKASVDVVNNNLNDKISHATEVISSTNANDFKGGVRFGYGDNIVNHPYTSGFIVSMSHAWADAGIQIAYATDFGSAVLKPCLRSYLGDTYSPWVYFDGTIKTP